MSIYLIQGDVKLEPCAKPTGKIKKLNHLILAKGEVTGHMHEVKGKGTLYEVDGKVYLDVLEDAPLTHQEHKFINLVPLKLGTYEVSKTYEYDHFLEESRETRD